MNKTVQLGAACCADIRGHGLDGTFGRRRFLSAAGLGLSIAALGTAWPGAIARAATTEALLLTCMDYRLIDDVVRYMDGRGMVDKYDQVILAGASLGAQTDKFPAWGTTFWEHLDVTIKLHNIQKVIVLDHRDCGAYKVVLGEDFAKDPAKETQIHTETLYGLKKAIGEKNVALQVELLLMALDGSVETIS